MSAKELNKLIKEMLGKPMTKEQLAFQDVLRAKVKTKKITVEEAHRIWNQKYRGLESDYFC
jgi:hypothetical protein